MDMQDGQDGLGGMIFLDCRFRGNDDVSIELTPVN